MTLLPSLGIAICVLAEVRCGQRMAGAAELAAYSPPPAGSVRITRDEYGVPHIVASQPRDLFYGAGYAQAEDQLENVIKNFFRGRGRAAEFEGRGQLVTDHLVRAMHLPQQASRQYAQLTGPARVHVDAFVLGLNAYLDAHRQELPAWLEPARPEDVLGFFLYTELMFTVSHCRDDLSDAKITVPVVGEDPRVKSTSRWWLDLNQVPLAAHTEAACFGSNQFAISPRRSTTGGALLSMDPHLPLSGFYRWYEMHLVGPEMNMMGAGFFGSPYVTMGRTQTAGWCMTVNAPDLGDVFSFAVNPEDPGQYRDLDGWKPFEDTVEVYRVREGEKTVERRLPCRRTVLGPVVVEKDGRAYVFALPWSESSNRVEQILAMAQSRSVADFRAALGPLGLVMFNLVYADVEGDIFYISNARIPRRDTRISSHAVRPGEESWARWQGYLSVDELPQVLNPPCGYLLNTNSGPQNVCPDAAPRPEDFPPYVFGQHANSRSRRLSALLAADEQISPDEMRDYAADTYLIAADEWVPRLVELLGSLGQSEQQKTQFTQAAEVLKNWNRRTDRDSRGAMLFVRLLANTPLGSSQAEALEPSAELRAQVAEELAAIAKDKFALDAPWGDFNRIRRGEIDLPLAGCGFREPKLSNLVALRPTYGLATRGQRYCVGGSSYGMIIDFSGGVRAVSCLPYGVSDVPSSPHFADHLPLYAEGKFKPAWFEPSEIEAHRRSQTVLSVPPAENR